METLVRKDIPWNDGRTLKGATCTCGKVVMIRAAGNSLYTHNRAPGQRCPLSRVEVNLVDSDAKVDAVAPAAAEAPAPVARFRYERFKVGGDWFYVYHGARYVGVIYKRDGRWYVNGKTPARPDTMHPTKVAAALTALALVNG